jgi:uncharacterized membrane protein YgcG
MPAPPKQTIPIGDRPFVEAGTRGLTLAAYQFLARLGDASNATAQNVRTIAAALGVPVETIPPGGATSLTIPASFPPTPDVAPVLRDAVADARLLAMLACVPRPPCVGRAAIPAPVVPPADIVVLHNGARVMDGFGAPGGRVVGSVGDLYLQRDGVATALWSKQSGAGSASGWVAGGGAGGGASGGSGGTGGVLPLVNGDTSPIGILSDPAGQAIGVPI